ncbi:MAG: hypothetical protein BGO72_09345 [Burkholderiales bacterium 70-64]|nr:MAG: hypothetical protein BGO72_09345 [Burkholderiales bacterium 70-64]
MPDRLSNLLTRFSAAARVDHTGVLRDTAAFDAAHDAGRLHLLRSGSVQALHAGWTPLKLVRPSLLFYPRPFEHRLQPVDGTAVSLMSAAIRFDGGSVNPLAAALPPLLVLPLEALAEARTTITQLFEEADGARCGHRIALDRLCDLLLVQVLRHVIDRALASSGMLAGLADARLSKALTALHDQPQRDWHLEDLAARAGMSRARFAARFKEKVGIAPGEYLTRWRISLAQHLLQQGRPVKEVAGEVGYASPAALGRVFATRTGVTPKAWANTRSQASTIDETLHA